MAQGISKHFDDLGQRLVFIDACKRSIYERKCYSIPACTEPFLQEIAGVAPVSVLANSEKKTAKAAAKPKSKSATKPKAKAASKTQSKIDKFPFMVTKPSMKA